MNNIENNFINNVPISFSSDDMTVIIHISGQGLNPVNGSL